MVNPQSIAICIITYYPKWYNGKLRSIKHTDKIRGDLALEFIGKAQKLGHQVIVSDATSSRSFRKILNEINGIHLKFRKTRKRSPGKRQTFNIAYRLEGVKAIVTAEPEKVSILDSFELITKPIFEGIADIVVPQRNDALFKKTYPLYMYESEVEGNKIYNEYLSLYKLTPKNESIDMFFGPRAFANKKEVVACFMKRFKLKTGKTILPHEYFDPEEYSNTSFFPIIVALKKRLKVKSVEIPFSYPAIQKQNEEANARELFLEKRKSQRLSLILELIQFLNYQKKF